MKSTSKRKAECPNSLTIDDKDTEALWTHFNGLGNSNTAVQTAQLLEAGQIKIQSRHSRSHISDHQGPHNCPLCHPVHPCNTVKCGFSRAQSHFGCMLRVPFAILLVFLDLQIESQQSQRLLCAGLSSNCQLIRERSFMQLSQDVQQSVTFEFALIVQI